jgi:hypothetical protein
MRRFVVFLFPTLVVLVLIGLLATVLRTETLRAQIGRFDWRARVESTNADGAEIAEVN